MPGTPPLLEQEEPNITILLERLIQILSQNSSSQTTSQTEGNIPPIAVRLNGQNYGLWAQVVEMHLTGKDKMGYINGEISPPRPSDPLYQKWKTEDSIVKGWLINSVESALIANFIHFSTAKDVWDAISTTFFDGNDHLQMYELKRKEARLRQSGKPIEEYYNTLQGLWREIDFRRPNPMKCPVDIEIYNLMVQEDRVFTFLGGLDDRLDSIRMDVLHMQPFPTVEQAYARVRREDMRQRVMLGKTEANNPTMLMKEANNSEVNLILTKPNYNESKGPVRKCTHCGYFGHTKENCFKIHGVPDWYKELKKKQQGAENKGEPAMVMGSSLSFVPLIDAEDSEGYSDEEDNWEWD